MELTFRRPDESAKISAEERGRIVREDSDLCVIDGKRFFIRAVLPLPVVGRELAYGIGLWVEVAEGAFRRILERWSAEDQVSEPPFAAHLANEIPIARGSLGLEAELRLTGPATRPDVFLKPSDHQLYVEQSRQIDAHRASEYNALFA